MKRIITLYLFAIFFAISYQTIEAQTINSINDSSLQKAKELQAKFNFNNETLNAIHQAYVEYDGRIASLNSVAKSKSGNKFGNKKHLLKIKLQKTIKKALNNDEVVFDKYLTSTNQQNFTKLVEKKEHSKTVNLIDKNPSYRSSRRTQGRSTKTVFLKEKRN